MEQTDITYAAQLITKHKYKAIQETKRHFRSRQTDLYELKLYKII